MCPRRRSRRGRHDRYAALRPNAQRDPAERGDHARRDGRHDVGTVCQLASPKTEALRETPSKALCTPLSAYQHTLTREQAQAAIARDWTRTPVELPERRWVPRLKALRRRPGPPSGGMGRRIRSRERGRFSSNDSRCKTEIGSCQNTPYGKPSTGESFRKRALSAD